MLGSILASQQTCPACITGWRTGVSPFKFKALLVNAFRSLRHKVFHITDALVIGDEKKDVRFVYGRGLYFFAVYYFVAMYKAGQGKKLYEKAYEDAQKRARGKKRVRYGHTETQQQRKGGLSKIVMHKAREGREKTLHPLDNRRNPHPKPNAHGHCAYLLVLSLKLIKQAA